MFTAILLLIFGLQLLAGGIAFFLSDRIWMNAQEYLQVTLPATLGLLGSAVGFYFGTRQQSSDSGGG